MKVETPHRRERIDQRLLDERSRDRMARERRAARVAATTSAPPISASRSRVAADGPGPDPVPGRNVRLAPGARVEQPSPWFRVAIPGGGR
jgi:hypothetical protein